MTKKDKELKELLDIEANSRNNCFELSYEKPDPLMVAKKQKDEYAILICALFAYGNAKQIVKFLDSLDFSLLEKSEKQIEELFFEGYKNENSVLEGIDFVIQKIKEKANYSSQGFDFLVGNPLKRDKNGKIKDSNAPYKRWNMFLRWMVRFDTLDLGLWKKIDKKDLILPLDTHTFKVSKKLGLLENRTYNLKSALEISQKLKEFDANDPIKYDFAIYRLGQEKII